MTAVGDDRNAALAAQFQAAVTCHQSGDLKQAESLYRQILATVPAHAETLHLLGCLQAHQGRLDAAIDYIGQAIQAQPERPDYYFSLGNALYAVGRLDGAAAGYRQAVQLRPEYSEAHGSLGNVLQDLGRLEESVTSYRQALAARPDFVDAHCNLGIALLALGRPDEAVAHLCEAQRLRPDLAEIHGNLGNALQAQGRTEDAIVSYRQALALKRDYPEAHSNLGNALQAQGCLDEAVAAYREALRLRPAFPEAHCNLGNALLAQSRLEEAEASIRRALALRHDYPEAHSNLGNVLQSQGRLDEAVAAYREALRLRQDYAEAWSNLGHVLRLQSRIEEAVTCCRQAVALRPGFAEGHSHLGNALQDQGRCDEAVACFREAIRLRPDYAEAHSNLGHVLRDLGQLGEAIASCRRALALKPDFAEACCNLGNALQDQCHLDEAVACFRQAILLRPQLAEAHFNLGNALKEQGLLDAAEEAYRQALSIRPGYAEAHSNLGNVLLAQSRLDEATACYRRALILKPDYVDAHSNLIFTLDLKPDVDMALLQAERRRWGEAFADALCPAAPVFANAANPADAERRLRIGYVSADFREHSAAVGFGAMLTRFDPLRFEVFAYSNSAVDDGHTRIFQQSVTRWRRIVGMSDAAVADLIRNDAIDILVDLSGHSRGNRLRVFARKPAPLQVTAWGYAGGTGMRAMDVLFSDAVVVPPEEKPFYTEEVRYLPCVISAYFPAPFPPVAVLPAAAASGEGVTFGSFNRLAKVAPETFAVWAQVLAAVPGSRMIFKSPELGSETMRRWVLDHFIRAGIDPARIEFLGRTAWHDHMTAFNRIDISLDTFPQSGGVTTLEGLMMGVPVITLRGTTFVGRGSAAILTALEMTDWIADTPQQYVDIAVGKASNVGGLADLRRQLRPRFMASIVGDTAAYVRKAESAYRDLWREWCRRQHDAGK